MRRETRTTARRSRRYLAPAIGMLVVAGSSLSSERTAMADPQACIEAHTSGQRASKAGHLRLASQLFTRCGADETCPEFIRRECMDFLDVAKKALPTVILSVLDENGNDISNVKVLSDDEVLSDSLNGRAVDVDPGQHHLKFLLPSGEELSTDVIVREAEKDRLVQVKVTKAPVVRPLEATPEAAPLATPAAATTTTAPSRSGPSAAAWITGAVAVAALATGASLGMVGKGKQNELDECKPDCPSSKRATYDNTKTLYLGADISFGVAAVAAGFATWLFLSPGSKSPSGSTGDARGVWLGVSPEWGGASAVAAGRF